MAAITPSRRYGSSGRLEVISWYFMRISGAVLLLVAVFHLMLMHVVIGVDNIDYSTIIGRWASPWWRLYDLALLFFALLHGTNGVRWVIDDYVHKPTANLLTKAVLYILVFILLLMGTQVIFTVDLSQTVEAATAIAGL